MDPNPVFRLLQEVFPQVDLRILKAVAIEHYKDVHAAVEFIVSEVLPSLSGPIRESYPINGPQEPKHSPAEVGTHKQGVFLQHRGVEEENSSLFSGISVACENACCNDYTTEAHIRSPCMEEALGEDSLVEVREPNEASLLLHHLDVVQEANASLPSQMKNLGKKRMVAGTSLANIHYLLVPNEELEEDEASVEHSNVQELCRIEVNGIESSVCTNQQNFSSSSVEESSDCTSRVEKDWESKYGELSRCLTNPPNVQSLCDLKANHTVSAAFTSAQDITLSTLENSSDFMECRAPVVKDSNVPVTEHEIQQSWFLAENGAELMAFETAMVSVDNTKPTKVGTQSGQDVGIDFLEGLINDSKNNKKTLISALESVSSMVTEVESHEKRAEHAKEEASKAGQDILSKIEDRKQIVKHAKEANDMHAGEVYGERAILATEARELQSRLLKLSDEREKSLSVIEEILRTLEARLAAAGEEQSAADRQKLEKEESAHKLLNEQELIMDSIVQESRRLKHEAEENSKLREFLIDRGRVVDVLQGEIAVICEDVMLLKDRVDGRLPLSKSLSWTTCSLAPLSSSYQRSILGDGVTHLGSADSQKMGSKDLPRSLQPEDISTTSDQQKVSSDDDWELCDAKVELNGNA